jgi:hypothetical protein
VASGQRAHAGHRSGQGKGCRQRRSSSPAPHQRTDSTTARAAGVNRRWHPSASDDSALRKSRQV